MNLDNQNKLRTGYTTGACATAATKAALLALQTQNRVESIEITLPIGRDVRFTIERCHFTEERAVCSVIKDAGDDPDVTDGAEVCATASWTDAKGIHIDGGDGVGIVTKPGLGLEVGSAAINPVPRKMIIDAILQVAGRELNKRGVNVIISVPQGEAIARKTLNPRLGIKGGISILGTTGIVVPYSTSAYRASIAQALNFAVANGCEHVVLTTGGRSEKFAQHLLPNLPDEVFIQIGEFLGYALKRCRRHPLKKVTFCGMVGKFSKVAAGSFQIHVRNSQVDFEFLASLAALSCASEELVAKIKTANTARHVSELAKQHGFDEIHQAICDRAYEECERFLKRKVSVSANTAGTLPVECILFDFDGRILARSYKQ
ncbi:TPA: cobalt-precorrin-5B (C(1))-methyltransferase [Candidatus Poribacteria bacterium]|nr:cobalt-precorrin-5B (C(1))-methyltransferase [Candidatus Poribacteria bacterium]